MIDHAADLAKSVEHQKKQEAARDSGHIVTIRQMPGFGGLVLEIDANFPVRVEVDGDIGYLMSGGAVDRYPGECKIGEVLIADLAKQGVTELVLDDEDDRKIVLPIPAFNGPSA